METELDRLASAHGSDKGPEPAGGLSGKGYTRIYSQFFAPLRELELDIVEIGIYRGASLKMWHDFFPNGRIFGVDVDPATSISSRVEHHRHRQAPLRIASAYVRLLRLTWASLGQLGLTWAYLG